MTNMRASAEVEEMITLLVPPFEWDVSFFMVVKTLVDTMTYSAPASLHLVLAAPHS